jgi:hypothetical protein
MKANKMLTTNTPPKFLETPRDPVRPGPIMGQAESPLQFITQNATPEEIAELARRIRDRIAREPREIFEVCMKCGNVSTRGFRRAAGRACFNCNFHGEVGGGFYRDMIPREVKAYQAREAKKESEWLERARLAAYNHDCEDRKKHGLEPLTRAQFDAREKANRETERARNRELMSLARRLAKDLPR